MKIAILISNKKNNHISDLGQVISEILKNNAEVLMCKDCCAGFIEFDITWFDNEKSMISSADFIVTMGGDGTIMRHAKSAAEYNKPVIGINTGRLGFISSLEKTEINMISSILKGNYFIDERIMFDVSTDMHEYKNLALNDTVISRGATSQVIDYDILRGNSKVCRFRADGVIISTPTGSTAYSMSAGGPIVAPGIECAVVTPICAHTLNSRPIILDLEEKIYVAYSVRKGSDAYVMCDGNKILNSNKTGVVGIRKSNLSVKFIRTDQDRFYKNVRLKLMG